MPLSGRVTEIKKRLKYLRKNNQDLRDEIRKAYDCDENLRAGGTRYEEKIEDCRKTVVALTQNLRGNCHFKEKYLQRLNANVLDVAYNNGVLGSFRDLRKKLYNRVEDDEDRIRRNQNEIDNLEEELRILTAEKGKQDD